MKVILPDAHRDSVRDIPPETPGTLRNISRPPAETQRDNALGTGLGVCHLCGGAQSLDSGRSACPICRGTGRCPCARILAYLVNGGAS